MKTAQVIKTIQGVARHVEDTQGGLEEGGGTGGGRRETRGGGREEEGEGGRGQGEGGGQEGGGRELFRLEIADHPCSNLHIVCGLFMVMTHCNGLEGSRIKEELLSFRQPLVGDVQLC